MSTRDRMTWTAWRAGVSALVAIAGLCGPSSGARADGEQPKNWDAHEAALRQRREDAEKQMAEQLEQLRRTNPEAYEQTKQVRERQLAIDKTMASYRKGALNQAAARKQLTPLVKARADEELKEINRRIESLRAELSRLEQLKANPAKWVGAEVERMTAPPKVSTD